MRRIKVGDRFGALVVTGKLPKMGNCKESYWLCQCACGKTKSVRARGMSRQESCGCLHFNIGSKNKNWKGYEEISGNFLGPIRRRAKKKGLSFSITLEQLWDLFLKQDRRCALTGDKLKFNSSTKDFSGTASLDRIDSNKGYDIENVQWVHKRVNTMKMDLPVLDFIEFSRKVEKNLLNKRKPKRIFLLRHGQSEGNIDNDVYNKKPDYSLALTHLGEQQAQDVSFEISKLIGQESVGIYFSPFQRTRQTATFIKQQLNVAFITEDSRLREQERTTRLGNTNEETEKERDAIGSFYFRFDGGESCADVYDRISQFLNTLFRDFEKADSPQNIIIVGHGAAHRVFLMRWFHWTPEEFELLRNPKNCDYYLLERQENGKYKLSTEPEKYERSYRIY